MSLICSFDVRAGGVYPHHKKSSPISSSPVLCISEKTLPSSEPVIIIGNSGWKLTHETF